jgi:hypothetical protein
MHIEDSPYFTECNGCRGTGDYKNCDGTGNQHPMRRRDGYTKCIRCNGTGICTGCNGSGIISAKVYKK